MNPAVSKRPSRGPTPKEVAVVVAILVILALLVLPVLSAAKIVAPRIVCTNNVKQLGVAARIFASDRGEKFAMEMPVNEGGTKGFAGFGVAIP